MNELESAMNRLPVGSRAIEFMFHRWGTIVNHEPQNGGIVSVGFRPDGWKEEDGYLSCHPFELKTEDEFEKWRGTK